jgi:predicted DCC family thiol-disulfide oxidoreductase YuxK
LRRATILYDRDCGFCRWSLAKLLRWDRRRALRPLALQHPDARGFSTDSWHLVTEDGRVLSGGAAVEPLMRLLPGGRPIAALARLLPRLTERTYRLVADHRGRLSRLLPAGAVERATARIDERSD